jgi:uncharacterized protein (UPF0303 family)
MMPWFYDAETLKVSERQWAAVGGQWPVKSKSPSLLIACSY